MSNTDVWMPLRIGKYLGDTMHLNGAQHGAYLLLIMHYWINGPLDDDDAILCAIARTERKIWDKEVGPAVRRFFKLGDDGLLHQRRCDAEREKVQAISAKRRVAAQASHEHRSNGSAGGGGASAPANGAAKAPASASANAPAIAEQVHMQAGLQTEGIARSRDLNLYQVREDSELTTFALTPAPADVRAPDVRKELWTEGIPIIRGLVGCPDAKARSLLGKLLKGCDDNAALVLRVLLEARSMRPIDPVAWLTKACRGRQNDTPEQIAKDWKLRSRLTDPDWDDNASYCTGLPH